MQVSQVMKRDVVACSIRDAGTHVVELMWKYDVGCLPVLDEGRRVIGIVTDRDVAIAGFLQGKPLHGIAVSTVMTKEVACCRDVSTLTEAGQMMAARCVRRIPVVDAAGVLQGMITLNDLARAATTGTFPAEHVVGALAAISHPRRELPAPDDTE